MKKIYLILVLIFTLKASCSERGALCKACIWGIELFKKFLRSDFMVNIYLNVYYANCMKTTNSEIYCAGRRDNVVIHESKAQFSYYNSEEICFNYNFCSNVDYVKDPVKSFAAKMLIKAPPPIDYEEIAPNKEKPIKFLVVTDIHMDFGYAEVSSYPYL